MTAIPDFNAGGYRFEDLLRERIVSSRGDLNFKQRGSASLVPSRSGFGRHGSQNPKFTPGSLSVRRCVTTRQHPQSPERGWRQIEAERRPHRAALAFHGAKRSLLAETVCMPHRPRGRKGNAMATDILRSDPALDFQKSSPALASSPEPSNFKFEREDWTLFRTVEGLQQKAGVPATRLRRLVLKEIADNALDTGTEVRRRTDRRPRVLRRGQRPRHRRHARRDRATVQHRPPDDLHQALAASDAWRARQRPARCRRCRAGVGRLAGGHHPQSADRAPSRARRHDDRGEHDQGRVSDRHPHRDRLRTGAAVRSSGACMGADSPPSGARERPTAGRSSPWWYDLSQFQELLYASGDRPVRELIANLDGCTGAQGRVRSSPRRSSIARRLQERHPRPGRQAVAGRARQCPPGEAGTARRGRTRCLPGLRVCHVVGGRRVRLDRAVGRNPIRGRDVGWQERTPRHNLLACVNRTPITGEVETARDKRDIDAFGCGLAHTIAQAPDGSQFGIVMNLITPYMPITSDGKEPNLRPFLDVITKTAAKVVQKGSPPDERRPHVAKGHRARKSRSGHRRCQRRWRVPIRRTPVALRHSPDRQ